ncbi:MAG: response regulator [Acidiferrobacterales bacterium]|nr:response regulator [Acidiferrobacterales bacterium]
MSSDNTIKATILVVDDNELNRDMLSRRLEREGYLAILASDGYMALEMLAVNEVDLVLLDIMMPQLDGYQVLERIKADPRLQKIPVIMITAIDEIDSTVKCIELGAEDYLPKPFNPVLLRARIGASLEKKRLHDMEAEYRSKIEQNNMVLSERVREQVMEIASAQLGAIFAMSKLAESRDPETGEHLDRMREYCRVLANQMRGMPKYADTIDHDFVDNIYAASPLHDIGKVGVPDAILCKPGKLTADEWIIMKTHPIVGAETLREVDRQHPGNAFVQTGIEIAEAHHEKWNGSGYPFGLAGEKIPLAARILALGDVYDALTSKRCYKDAFATDEARKIIINDRGVHFDPDVVDAFLATEDEFARIRVEYQDAL